MSVCGGCWTQHADATEFPSVCPSCGMVAVAAIDVTYFTTVLAPKANGVIRNLSDADLCGDE